MKLEFDINIKASNSVGTAMSFKVSGKGTFYDYFVGSLKVHKKLQELLDEETLIQINSLRS